MDINHKDIMLNEALGQQDCFEQTIFRQRLFNPEELVTLAKP
jgi:hypothetical protein